MQVGRNDQCPCGSGKKYKKCCLAEDEGFAGRQTPSARSWHDLDHRLVEEMGRWAAKRFGDLHRHAPADFPVDLDPKAPESTAYLPLFATWMAYERKLEGQTLAAWYLAERGKYLTADDRRWLQAQGRAWLSVWEVTRVVPGERIEVKDRLTGVERVVVERTASKTMQANVLVLARVVDIDEVSLFCGMHPNTLYPGDGKAVVAQAREELGLGKTNTPETLRAGDLATALIDIWDVAVHEAMNRPLPQLTNTDGEALVLIEEHFTVAGGAAGRLELARVLEAESDVRQAGPGHYSLVRSGPNPASEAMQNTIIATVRLAGRELVAQTNSRERAARVRERLLALGGKRLRPGRRTERSAEELMAEAKAGGSEGSGQRVSGPEADALVRQFKAKHYASWVDDSLPALDGLTPREAASQASYRDRLITLLADMEARENQQPESTRFDFGQLRRDLGIGGR
jgi:hypothetical protein